MTARPFENNRILIIDDNPAIHADFRKILSVSNAGQADLLAEAAAIFGQPTTAREERLFELESAFQGQEGLAVATAARDEGRPFALAFVDVRMPPGWDGVETIGRLWEMDPDLQIVICTAYSDHSWEEIVHQLGRKESLLILKKPFDNVEVLQLAHALTEKWALNRQLMAQVTTLEQLVSERTARLEQANRDLLREAADREKVQQRLTRSEERFSKAFHASPIPIAIQTVADGRCVDVNASFLSMIGRANTVADIDAGEIRVPLSPTVAATVIEQIAAGQLVRNIVCQIEGANGVRDVLLSADALTLGEQACVLTMFVDISEQRQLEERLRRSQKLEAVGQLAAGIAHNFNNILTVIQGYASLQLYAENLDEETTEAFEQISKASDRAASLVQQLLAAGRQQTYEEIDIDLNELIARSTQLLRNVVGDHVQITFSGETGLPCIRADEGNVEQIVMNLVVNARDAITHGGTISITTALVQLDEEAVRSNPDARTGSFVRMKVTDDGPGIEPKVLARIFEPFFTTKDVGKGSGLGLATVHGIVGQHGGWIEVNSEVGSGTTFTIHLPAGKPAHMAAVGATAGQLVTGTGETILLVEDEAGVRKIVKSTLESHGYRVLSAGNGKDALSLWENNRNEVDILLTDVVMPGGLSGCELARRIRQSRPSLPVILSSGYNSEMATQNARPDDVVFLAKPFSACAVLNAVRQSLGAERG